MASQLRVLCTDAIREIRNNIMIGSLRGKVLRIDGVTALIEVSTGVGYEVDMPVSCLSELKIDAPCFVYIHHVVREDAQVLFGFSSLTQRALFRALIKVNGVGPKMALAVLSTFSVDEFVSSVLQEKSSSLEQIPGVGKKTASRLVVELKDSLKNFANDNTQSLQANQGQINSSDDRFSDAVAAMTALGYKENDSVKYVKLVLKDDPSLSTQQIIVKALSLISKGGR